MIKKLSKIEYILFSLLCIVSVFAFSNSMTDTYIVPNGVILFWFLCCT